MIKRSFFGFIITVCIFCLFAQTPSAVHAQTKEKVGILFLHTGGGNWNYSAEWIPPFFSNLWGIFADGFHTGGYVGHENDKLKCYTQIHYANEEEAAGCDTEVDTLIDVMCNEYPVGTAVHTVSEYGPGGDGSFSTDCYPGYGLPYAMMQSPAWQSTIDPFGVTIVSPVLDPSAAFNPGQGIAEFFETISWTRFGYMAELPNSYDPSKKDWMKWWYGNDTPCGDDPLCAPDPVELSNAKDSVLADSSLTDNYDFVFRHGWESRMKNLDIRGNTLATPYSDSTETALKELIEVEGVDRIVVVHAQPSFANMSQYGGEWLQSNFRYDPVEGEPMSRVAGKTYKQCIEELDDDYGPGWTKGTVHDPEERDLYLAEKPWEDRPTEPWPEIVSMVDDIATDHGASVDLQFAPSYGTFDEFSLSVNNWIEYTVDSFAVPEDGSASLAVVLVDHGYHGAHRDAATCDAWFSENAGMFEQVQSSILSGSLPAKFSKFKVVRGFGEYAEGHYSTSDKPTALKPFGDIMSMGEQIDNATNGTYVNSQGEIIDNGNDNYQYIIAVPYFFEGFSSDYHEKKETLGNMVDEAGNGHFERATSSPDGDPWGPHDYVGYVNEATTYDGEYAVSVVLDQTVFASEVNSVVTYKGSTANPTTVIIPGPALSLPDTVGVRDNLVSALNESIAEVLAVDQPPEITSDLLRTGDGVALSTNPAAPTTVPGDSYIYWTYADDQFSCTGVTHQWKYRVAGTTDLMTVNTITKGLAWYFVWTPLVSTMSSGTYEIQAVVTDCADQSVTSESYYFSVDMDGDGISDDADNCPDNCNTGQLDADGDSIGDVCDLDPGCGGCGQPACEPEC